MPMTNMPVTNMPAATVPTTNSAAANIMARRGRLAAWGMALATVLLFSGCMTTDGYGGYPQGGQYPQQPYPEQPYPGQAGNQVVGTVQSIDPGGRLLLDSDSGYGGGSRIEVMFDQNTQLYYQGQSYAVTGLEPGDRIRIDATQSGGQLWARSIEVLQNVRDVQGGQYGNELGGAVSFVDPRARVIGFTRGGYSGAATEVRYDDRTVVEYRGQRLRPDNLERGDVVRIQARQSGSEWLAERIVVETSARERY